MTHKNESIQNLIRNADCSGCQYADTHEGISCYMFEDRAVCYVKRMPNQVGIPRTGKEGETP